MNTLFDDYLARMPYTAQAKAALDCAEREALLLGGAAVGTEHLLLGLSADSQSAAGALLASHQVDADSVRGMILKLTGVERKKDVSEPEVRKLPFSAACTRVLARSAEIARGLFPLRRAPVQIGTEHLLIALFKEPDSVAVRIMAELGVQAGAFFTDVQNLVRTREFIRMGSAPEEESAVTGRTVEKTGNVSSEGTSEPLREIGGALSQFGRDMTLAALSGTYDPVVGRQDEMKRILQILSRKTKNSPCLVGEPGVGKTAIVEGIAQRIARGDVPENMKNKHLIALDLPAIVAGTKYRGEFEERMQHIIEEAMMNRQVILFIDEIHTIIGSGSSEGTLDAANILKPALSRGELRVIGATTREEYRKYFEKDAALSRRFQTVTVREPDETESLAILRGLRASYEQFHHVSISDEVIECAIRLSKRYIPDRCLPDKAIDVLDEAASAKRMETQQPRKNQKLDLLRENLLECYQEKIRAIQKGDKEEAAKAHAREEELRSLLLRGDAMGSVLDEMRNTLCLPLETADIEQVVSAWSGVPVSRFGEEESKRLLELESLLHHRVVGQQDAISALAKAVRRGRTGMKDPKRPIGSFFFLGPTGVGKTEVARALAESLFGDEKALIRIDMSEYMEAHSVSRMVGSPPGYVGHEEGGQLTERVRTNPYSVILLDEVEKAHPDVFNILLQVLEDGQLTDTKGRTVDFKNTVLIMTSNIGARNITEPKRLGFAAADTEDERFTRMQSAINEELRKAFKPEFLNRVDETVVFRPLNQAEIREIALLQLTALQKRAAQNGVTLSYEDAVPDHLAEKGYSPLFGARPLKRLIRQEIEDLLSEEILRSGGLGNQIKVHLVMREGKVEADGER